MNQSNTRLSADEKEILVDMKEEFADAGGEAFYFPESGLTVAMLPAGVVTKVATAFSSPMEKKFRRKVGAYKAISRVWWDCECMLIPSVACNEDWASEFNMLCVDCML
ncbi:MAG: hypothetical protein QX189_09675 [Methylococcales bacterium]